MAWSGTSTHSMTSNISRYGLAALSVAAALLIRELLRAYFEPTPNAFFFCAVALTSWLGGFGPGLLASVLSIWLIDYHFTAPYYIPEIGAEDLPRLIVFLDRKSTRLNSSHLGISYAVFCLKK